MDRGAWWAIAMGSQRVGHDLVTKPPYRFDYINFVSVTKPPYRFDYINFVSFSPVFLSLLLVFGCLLLLFYMLLFYIIFSFVLLTKYGQ